MARRLLHSRVLPAVLALTASVGVACGDGNDDGGGDGSGGDGGGATTSVDGGQSGDGRQSGGGDGGTDGDGGGAGEGVFARIPGIVEEVQPSVVAVTTGGGEGSGVVYDAGGVIVTNAHVVGDADTVAVRFADGEQVDAQVVAADPTVDLAVLATGREGLPAATFAAGIPEVGELAVAIGNPLGFENTVTAGIVSGLERSIPGGGPSLAGLVQTDAPISPGSSGGALVDAAGEVIGINVAYIPPEGGAVSIGFAIPSPVVVDVVDELLADGEVEHSYLGIVPHELTPQLAQRYAIEAEEGVLVLDVVAGGPAAAAGIEPGDVVVGLGGDEVTELGDLLEALRSREPGEAVEVALVRGSEEVTVDVTLGQPPS